MMGTGFLTTLKQLGYSFREPQNRQKIGCVILREIVYKNKKTLAADLYPSLTVTSSGKPFGMYHTTTFFVNSEEDLQELLNWLERNKIESGSLRINDKQIVTNNGETAQPIKRSVDGTSKSANEIHVDGVIEFYTKPNRAGGETKVFKRFL